MYTCFVVVVVSMYVYAHLVQIFQLNSMVTFCGEYEKEGDCRRRNKCADRPVWMEKGKK